ncbi:type II toxin-antitoxin system HipA family toxin [Flavobacteriaceae bacterium MHTCC 0001]
MKNLDKIEVCIFDIKVGVLAFDKEKSISYFQYYPNFLEPESYLNIFPIGIKKTPMVQKFKTYNTVFNGLPPQIADSLPDDFGNRIFNEWLKLKKVDIKAISPVYQLAYLSKRGMGALEYIPGLELRKKENQTIDFDKITGVLNIIMDSKRDYNEIQLDDLSLLNIYHLGTSMGGARPKVVVSEHRITNQIIPGDVTFSNEYNHYLVKLNLGKDSYNKELVEYAYYKMATCVGLDMMPCKMIDGKHFATLRYDRINGEKVHVLTASGISGYSFRDPEMSSYENLFKIANKIKIPPADMDALFRRMVFNFTFKNVDDHLKNHSFIFDRKTNKWRLSKSYDINYPLDALNKYLNSPHALSLNKKRVNINITDLMLMADLYGIKNPNKIIKEVNKGICLWDEIAEALHIPTRVKDAIKKDFTNFLI